MGNTPSNLASLGVISFGSQDKIGARIDGRADQDWTVNSARGTHIRFLTCDNGTTQLDERVRITSAGLVGIGSTAPTLALDINRGANSGVFLGNPTHGYKVRANVSGINDYGILIEDEDGVDLYRAVSSTGTSNADTHTFFTAGDERLRITSNGNIEVQGTRAGALQANDDDALKLFTKSTSDDINRGVGITFYTHDGSGYEMGGTIQVAKENGTVDDPKSYMRFSTQSGSTTTERLRITSDGSIGINANNPNAGDMATGSSQNKPLLHVYGSGSSATGGEYNLLARFEAGGDADETGAMIVLNHSNDRGLAIEGGRRTGNYAHGALKMIDNVGRVSDAMLIHGGAGQGVNHIALFTGAATTTTVRLLIDSSGRSLFKTNGSQASPVTDDNVPVQIAESTGGYCYFGANKGNSYGSIFGHHTNYGGTVIRNLTSDNIVFMTNNNAERLRITSDGTTISTISSPDPYNTVNENIRIVNAAGNRGAGSKIRFATGAANAHIESRITGGNSNSGTSLNFATSPANSDAEECLRITPSGNILQRARPYSNSHQNPGWGMGRYVKSGWLMAQSSFSNPVMDLVELLDQGNSYQNIFFKVTAMQLRFRGNNYPEGQIHTGYASAKRDPSGTNTWYAYVGTMVLENAASGFASGSNVGTLSWSASNNFDTATLRYTGNREDNYDTYQVCVEVWSNNNDSLGFKLASGYLA